MYALRNIPPLQTGSRKDFSDRQMIFPNITFTCSGEIVKWIMAAKWNDDDHHHDHDEYPQLQIWRPLEGSTYERIHSTDLSTTTEENDEVYEFPVNPHLPFQRGDILGVLQPDAGDSRLQVRYDSGDEYSVSYYYTGADYANNTFTIVDDSGTDSSSTGGTGSRRRRSRSSRSRRAGGSEDGVGMAMALPLITAEISKMNE